MPCHCCYLYFLFSAVLVIDLDVIVVGNIAVFVVSIVVVVHILVNDTKAVIFAVGVAMLAVVGLIVVVFLPLCCHIF